MSGVTVVKSESYLNQSVQLATRRRQFPKGHKRQVHALLQDNVKAISCAELAASAYRLVSQPAHLAQLTGPSSASLLTINVAPAFALSRWK